MPSEIIRYIKKRAMKALLHVFWVFPVDRGKVFLLNELSYTYGDSLKYIDLYLRANHKDKYIVVFAIKDGYDGPAYDTIVRPNTWAYFKQILTSGAIITNAGGVSYLAKRKKQLVINTWHGGGPYKKTSTDVYDNYWYRKEIRMNHDNTDYMLSTCKNFTEVEARSMGFEKKQCIPVGLPRNDILFKDHSRVRDAVRAHYGIPEGTKLVLYAPTFRSDSDQSTSRMISNVIDIDVDMLLSALKARFGCVWTCGIRLHPKLADIDMSGLNVVNCTRYPDMQELLCAADAVITDYSSLMWDFSFTLRPIFLYAPDIERYEKERGFYLPVSQWPYPIAHNNDELKDIVLNFDEAQYQKRVREHHMATESYETGRACASIVELIESVRQG